MLCSLFWLQRSSVVILIILLRRLQGAVIPPPSPQIMWLILWLLNSLICSTHRPFLPQITICPTLYLFHCRTLSAFPQSLLVHSGLLNVSSGLMSSCLCLGADNRDDIGYYSWGASCVTWETSHLLTPVSIRIADKIQVSKGRRRRVFWENIGLS